MPKISTWMEMGVHDYLQTQFETFKWRPTNSIYMEVTPFWWRDQVQTKEVQLHFTSCKWMVVWTICIECNGQWVFNHNRWYDDKLNQWFGMISLTTVGLVGQKHLVTYCISLQVKRGVRRIWLGLDLFTKP